MAEQLDLEIVTPERQLVHEQVSDVQLPGKVAVRDAVSWLSFYGQSERRVGLLRDHQAGDRWGRAESTARLPVAASA